MAIITDPDNLDRIQVLVDYYNQKIGIKPVLSSTPLVQRNLFAETGVGRTQGDFSYPKQFQDTTKNFTTSGVQSGDILAIINGQNIDHWTITGLVGNTGLLVDSAFGATGETDINYAVVSGVGGTVTDGATLQAVYSFLKEEWKTAGSGFVDLIQFVFPLESITREQFEIGGPTHANFNWRDDDTRNLIRTGGWAAINQAGTTLERYAGVITLGSLDADTQVYYQQVDSTSGTATDPRNFVLTGPVNQAILVDTNGGDDLRGFLKLFARKKGKTYAGSEIADIGVSTLETIVNRFPVSHLDDPAIVDSDGQLAGGAKIYQTGVVLFTAGDIDTSASAASAQENTFTITVDAGDFVGSGITVKDFVNLQGSDAAINDDFFEIVSVDSATQLTLLQEPTVAVPVEVDINGTFYSRRRSNERSDGRLQNVGGSDASGTLNSAASDFSGSGVVAGDIVGVLASGSTSLDANVGTYKVLSVTDGQNVVLDTQDQPFPTTQTAADYNFEVYRPGMYLQYKKEVATNIGADATSGVVFTSASPDTVQRRDGGDFSTDGYVVGGVLRVGTSENAGENDGSYVISGISTTTTTNDTISLFQATTLTTNAADTTATLSGENGFIRSPQSQAFSFNWRLFGNNGTLANCFQWLQKELRRGFATSLDDSDFRGVADISTSSGVFRGDITDLLMSFASPNGTTLNLFIDDLNANEKNNITFNDVLGVGRNFAFLSVISISVNSNLLDDSDTKIVVFFSNDDAGDNTGRDYGTDEAIIVQDTSNADMISLDPSTSPVDFEFDFDNNTQRGAASAGENAPVTIVAIGLNTAQYVSTAGTVTRQSTNVFSLVSALERNYSNT